MLTGPIRIVGSGRPAILQGPAWGPSSEYLRVTLAPLLAGLQVACFDARNTGRAERRPSAGSQATAHLVDDLEAVRARLELERFVLIGHSHGAFVSMAYAQRHPHRVGALILLTPSLGPAAGVEERERILTLYARDPARRAAVEWYRSQPRDPATLSSDRLLARWLRRTMPLAFYDLENLRRFERQLVGVVAPSAVALAGMPAQQEAWVGAGLSAVQTPTLVVSADHDISTTVTEGRDVASRIAGSRFTILRRCGHNPWAERPRQLAAELGAFLEAHPGP